MYRLLMICALILVMAVTPAAMSQAQTTSETAPNSYRLGAGDQLRITVFGETELTGEYTVATDGRLTFPLVGEVPAAGLTPEQLSAAIADRLRGGYLREPRVASSVISYRPFYILGEVENPGTYPYAANLDVLGAVAVAGGFTYRANQRRVRIRHLGSNEERTYDLSSPVSVQPGDTIRIGERWF
jgi:protein involved in polysaccharide export with SLBB domain